jgi:hypothetical protein
MSFDIPINPQSNYAWRFTDGKLVDGKMVFNVQIIRFK